MNIETFQLTANEHSDSTTRCQVLDFHCRRGPEKNIPVALSGPKGCCWLTVSADAGFCRRFALRWRLVRSGWQIWRRFRGNGGLSSAPRSGWSYAVSLERRGSGIAPPVAETSGMKALEVLICAGKILAVDNRDISRYILLFAD